MPLNKRPSKNPNDELARNKKLNEAIKKYENIYNYNRAVEKAARRWGSLVDDFFEMKVDQEWKDLWNKQQKESNDKFDSGEDDAIESYERDIRWLKGAIRKIKAELQVADVKLDDIIMDLESKVDNPQGSEDHPRGSRITRKNPTPISVLRLRENNGDDEYWERLYKIRAARGQAEARWVQWVKALPLGRGLTMAAIERQANFLNSQPKVNKYSDERLEQIIEETNFYERDIIENS